MWLFLYVCVRQTDNSQFEKNYPQPCHFKKKSSKQWKKHQNYNQWHTKYLGVGYFDTMCDFTKLNVNVENFWKYHIDFLLTFDNQHPIPNTPKHIWHHFPSNICKKKHLIEYFIQCKNKCGFILTANCMSLEHTFEVFVCWIVSSILTFNIQNNIHNKIYDQTDCCVSWVSHSNSPHTVHALYQVSHCM